MWVQFYCLLPNITLIKDLLKNFYFEHEKAIISMYRYVIIILPNLTLFKLFKLLILCYLSFYWILWNIFKLFIKSSERLLNNWKSWTYFIHLLAQVIFITHIQIFMMTLIVTLVNEHQCSTKLITQAPMYNKVENTSTYVQQSWAPKLKTFSQLYRT